MNCPRCHTWLRDDPGVPMESESAHIHDDARCALKRKMRAAGDAMKLRVLATILELEGEPLVHHEKGEGVGRYGLDFELSRRMG